MFWGSQGRKQPADENEQPIHRENKTPPHQLPPQESGDREDAFYDDIYSSYSVDSKDTPYRYAGYANRLRTLLRASHRYVAYTSDIGESFRPVAHPYLVRTAYGISWTYVIGDVFHEGYKAYLRNRQVLAPPCESYRDAKAFSQEDLVRGMATGNIAGSLRPGPDSSSSSDTLTPWPITRIPLIEDYRMVMAKRAVFQSIASMGLPALTIHSVVKYSGRMFKNSNSAFLRTWAPIGLGLSVVPFLPYVFDEPVEKAVDLAFRLGIRAYACEGAIEHPLPHTADIQDDKTKNSGGSRTPTAPSSDASWEEYKEQRLRAKELRKREREERGQNGLLTVLGWGGGGNSKDKTE